MRNPARGGKGEEEAGPPHARPHSSGVTGSLTAQGRGEKETQGTRRAATEALGGRPSPPLTSESEPSPSMVAFCQVSSKAGSKQADGRPLAGSGERVPVAALEPRFGAGGRAGQPDPTSGPTRRGRGQGGRKQRRGETSFAPYGDSVNPAPQPAAAAAPAACGWAGSHAEIRARGPWRAGPGRGGAVARATAPTAQRRRGRGRAGGRPSGGAVGGGVAVGGVPARSATAAALSPPLLTAARAATFAPCRVESLGGSEVRAGKGGGGRGPTRGGAAVERSGGAAPDYFPGHCSAPTLCSSFFFPCALLKRGLSIQRQAPFSDSSQGGRERAGPGRLPVPSHPAHRVARGGGDQGETQLTPPQPGPGVSPRGSLSSPRSPPSLPARFVACTSHSLTGHQPLVFCFCFYTPGRRAATHGTFLPSGAGTSRSVGGPSPGYWPGIRGGSSLPRLVCASRRRRRRAVPTPGHGGCGEIGTAGWSLTAPAPTHPGGGLPPCVQAPFFQVGD